MQNSDNVQFSQRAVISIPPSDTREIQLRVIDWKRVYRRIKSIDTDMVNRELFAGIAWGITASALLSLIPLFQAAEKVDPWVKPTFMIVSVASLIVGIIIWNTMKDTSTDIAEVRSEVLTDMEEIHCLYFPQEKLSEQ